MRSLALLSAVLLVAACDLDPDPDESTADQPLGQASEHAAPVCPGPAGPATTRCHARVIVDDRGEPRISSGPAGYVPADLRGAYNITGTGASTTMIAIIDAYGYSNAEADLAVYRAQFGLPPCTTANGCFRKLNQVGIAGSYPRDNTGWAQESALDLDMASAMCPSCRLVLVEANSNSFANLAAAVDTAARLGAHVISNSYGGAEGSSAAYEVHYDHPGVAITVSSGDNGYGVEFPAASPHVIAVGGTHLVPAANARGWEETTWSGAGSGCSAVYSKPAWQTDPGCARRTVADVSAIADPNTGVAVYGPARKSRSGWMTFGGTSVGAPLIGGVYGVNGGAVTYGRDPYDHAPALFDVIAGSNGTCGGSYLCTAGAGYDGPTGLGSPDGASAL
jgi:subtilase family serine protease